MIDQVETLQRTVTSLERETQILRQRTKALTGESKLYRDQWQQALRDLDEQTALMETYKEESARMREMIQLNGIEFQTHY